MQSASTPALQKPGMNMLVTSKEQILSGYPDIFEGIGRFPEPYHFKTPDDITHLIADSCVMMYAIARRVIGIKN